jgi:hypothetical protein
MIFYLMFALRCRQADFVASVSPLVLLTPVKIIAGVVVTGDTKLPVTLLLAINYCRSCCYRQKIYRRNNDIGDKHKVTNISANFL